MEPHVWHSQNMVYVNVVWSFTNNENPIWLNPCVNGLVTILQTYGLD